MEIYHQLTEYLKAQNKTIATAESCTGGLIAKLITDVPGASQVFLGGVVSYSNEMKVKLLGVNQDTLMSHGAVSEEAVKEMLAGILRLTGCDVAIAVSGIAGPTGGTKDKPVGTVFIGVAFLPHQLISRFQFSGTRDEIRIATALKAAELILTLM